MRSRSWREITAGRGEERGKTSSRDAIGSPHTHQRKEEKFRPRLGLLHLDEKAVRWFALGRQH